MAASPSGAAVLEEGPEPTSGGAAVPIVLIAMLALLLYAACVHLNDRGGEFDPKVYYPFANANDVAEAHPKDPRERPGLSESKSMAGSAAYHATR